MISILIREGQRAPRHGPTLLETVQDWIRASEPIFAFIGILFCLLIVVFFVVWRLGWFRQETE
jgi:hypothetical protein